MLLQLYHLKEKKTVLPTQTVLFDRAVLLTKVSILNRVGSILVPRGVFRLITQACNDFDVCIKLTVFEQFRPPDYENDFGFALSRLVFSQIVFS
jgi:hypothetical protein